VPIRFNDGQRFEDTTVMCLAALQRGTLSVDAEKGNRNGVIDAIAGDRKGDGDLVFKGAVTP
jgi:hypothetical protein